MNKQLILTLILCSIIVGLPNIATVDAEEWVEVASWNEPVSKSPFIVDYVDWKLGWDFGKAGLGTTYTITLFDESNNTIFVKSGYVSFTQKTKGKYTHNVSGLYSVTIETVNMNNFEVNFEVYVIENIDSIPEFPSWIILPLFLTATLVIVIFRKSLKKSGNYL